MTDEPLTREPSITDRRLVIKMAHHYGHLQQLEDAIEEAASKRDEAEAALERWYHEYQAELQAAEVDEQALRAFYRAQEEEATHG